MTLLLFLVAVVLVGTACVLVVRAFVLPRLRTGEALEQIGAYGFASSQRRTQRTTGPLAAAVESIAGVLGNLVAGGAGGVREATLRNQLMAAGIYQLSPRTFMGYRILSTIAVPALWVWLSAVGNLGTATAVLGFLACLGVGWVLPMTMVKQRARRRLEQIEYELPEMIDLLVVTVEAGLGLSGSLQLAGQRFGGPLGEELQLTLQEQNLGIATNDALRHLMDRANTPSVRSFVRSIVQGEQLGVSIGQIMRNLSNEMRLRRRQAAEEKAHKAPIKILFPLVFLIFPAMFVIILAPAVFGFLDAI